jgi:hypothetical protein
MGSSFVIQRGVETAATGTGWLFRICGVLFLNCARLDGPNAHEAGFACSWRIFSAPGRPRIDRPALAVLAY